MMKNTLTKTALALAAIIVVVLSAGFRTPPTSSVTLGQARQALPMRRNALLAGEADLMLLGTRQAASVAAVAAPAESEGPPLVLLAYLALVVVGSALAIGTVRANSRREG